MNSVKISIIVAAYNVAEWLPRCVNSIIAQSYTNWELILIDDGSKDETGKIADCFAEHDSRIIVVHQKNTGLVMVREKGISLASGEYIGFIDGDDAIDSDMYEKLLANALVYDAEISHCNLRVCYNGKDDEGAKDTNKIVVQNSEEAIKELLSGEWMAPSLCNKLYRKNLLIDSCLDKAVINNEDLLRNFVLFKRAKKIVFQDFQGYQYWTRENSLSNDVRIFERTNDILSARRCILNNSESNISTYAMRSWLSANVNAINSLTFYEDENAKLICRKCRYELKKELKNIKLLILRQRIAAILIVISPTLHRLIYQFYKEGI